MSESFSKPLSNILQETNRLTLNDKVIKLQQEKTSKILTTQPNRVCCMLCSTEIFEENSFLHRGIQYVQCVQCRHIQTRTTLPVNFPYSSDGIGFDSIYPELDCDEYESRRKRVYDPKLDWILKNLDFVGDKPFDWLETSWMELGSGAGYFLSALKDRGVASIAGIEKNSSLAKFSNRILGNVVVHSQIELADAFVHYPAQIYVAFFVLEHIDDAKYFWDKLSKLPRGTIFVFSVPIFGFATLLESIFHEHAARNLDSVLHTQLYTDESLKYSLQTAGFKKIAQWTFGQDAQDFLRLCLMKLETCYSEKMMIDISQKLNNILDPMQNMLDENYFSDARHIMAVKT